MRLGRIVALALVAYLTLCAFQEANKPIASLRRDQHPLPCIRHHEGTYSHRGRYVGAYQFRESTYKSVSNARQDALWPRLHLRENWHEQDRAAARLYELRGLSRWSNIVRRNCA